MKPIHHALVSTRLFGGAPKDYLAVHNAFDMSKAALPDMRHRAALHSVDHGAAVMELIFPERIGGTTLGDICFQHVNDDQGFDVKLDHWLAECQVPGYAMAFRAPPEGLEGFLISPAQACADRWGGSERDYAAICEYYTLPSRFSDHPMAPAVALNAFGIFFSEMAFGQAIEVARSDGRTRYVAIRDIGECISLARYSKILSLADVFQTMAKKPWMTGSRVERSRQRRMKVASRSDLFDETAQTKNDPAASFLDEDAVKVVLND